MKRLITTPLNWIAGLALVIIARIIFALDDWRMRRITRRELK